MKKIILFGIGVMTLLLVTSCETADKQLEANLEMYERVWNNALNNDDWTEVNEDNFDKNVTLVLQPENIVGVQGV